MYVQTMNVNVESSTLSKIGKESDINREIRKKVLAALHTNVMSVE